MGQNTSIGATYFVDPATRPPAVAMTSFVMKTEGQGQGVIA